MPPTAKDIDVTNPGSTTTAGRSASAGVPEEHAGRPQPVPLEVPVTVNGARTVEGSDKREPFSETTMTVLVFGNGAVIRLASSVAAGQLLFLTNEKTKKEVVCQVVKSKNYKNVSGYVELEFTEAVPGFWGLRFPGDQAAAPTRTAVPAAVVKPIAPAAVAPKAPPAVNAVTQKLEPKAVQAAAPPAPAATVPSSPLSAEIKPPANLPNATELKPAVYSSSSSQTQAPQHSVTSSTTYRTVLPKAPGLTDGLGTGLTSTARPAESKGPAPVASKSSQTPIIPANPSDALRRESERLQEQLASMLFAAEVPATPVQAASGMPAAEKSSTASLPGKIVEIAKPHAPGPRVASKVTPIQPHSSIEEEEVKIPSWLEPLARNAATQAQNENIAKTELASANKVIEFEVQDASAPAVAELVESATSAEGSRGIHLQEAAPIQVRSGSGNKNKGLLIGAIAAGLLVAAAGGTWYVRQSAAPAQQAAGVSTAAVEPGVAQPAVGSTDRSGARNTPQIPVPNRSNINSEPVAKSPASASPSQVNVQSAGPEAQLVKAVPEKSTAAELSEYKKLAEPAIQPSSKKPGLGPVHLSAPKAGRTAAPDFDNADAGLGLNAGQVVPSGDSFGGILMAGNSRQPVAPATPLPIGGDVKSARLLSSPPPTYPTLAKTQRIQGAVLLDAVVDTNGKISSMKVISGPPLLHQAAMDALRQWKYQPATLDGKPVSMHLTVTVQFRLQ